MSGLLRFQRGHMFNTELFAVPAFGRGGNDRTDSLAGWLAD